MAVSACVRAFILAIICGNPILRGTLVTILNSLLVRLSFDIDQIILLIGRLNVHNQILSLGINTLNALKDRVGSDLNLILGPFQQFFDCIDLRSLLDTIKAPAVGKSLKALEKKIKDLNRATNLIRIQDSIKQRKEDELERVQDFIDDIASLCP